MDLSTKEKFDEYVKGLAKEIGQEMIAEARKEAEARAAETRDALTKQFMAAKPASDGLTLEKGIMAARIFRAYAAQRVTGLSPVDYAKKWEMGDAVEKALATAPGSSGGYAIPPGYSSELIALLYNKTAVRKLGAITVPLPNGNMTWPKLTAGITATYIGENAGQNSQQQTFGNFTLSWRKLRASVPISNDSIRFSDPKLDAVVRDDMLNAFAVAEDAAFLFGSGVTPNPKGIYTAMAAGNKVTTTDATGADVTKIIADITSLLIKLKQQNIPGIKLGWVFAPQVEMFLMRVRDGVGSFLFQQEMLGGKFWGIPFVSTNQMPINLGGGTDESLVLLADFNDVVIGESTDLLVDTSQEASYKDGSGNLVSAFDLDQTIIRGIARHDIGLRRDFSVTTLEGIKWGAVA